MRRAAVLTGYAATAALLLSSLSPRWYSTPSPHPCIEIAPAACPAFASLGDVAGDLQRWLVAAALAFAALLTVRLVAQRPALSVALLLAAAGATGLIAYSAVDLPAVGYAPHVGLAAGFFVAATAALLMLLASMALALPTMRRSEMRESHGP